MILIQILLCSVLHLLSKLFLNKLLCNKLNVPPYKFTLQFSGRIALYVLAKSLRRSSSKTVALLPDYVCNVLFRAINMAGWGIKIYNTNNNFEPNIKEILHSIELYDVGLIVGASVYGSSGLLDVLDVKEMVQLIQDNNIQVIIDMAQDISLIKKLPLYYSDFVHAIISFNDKSISGAMGGGILSKKYIRGKLTKVNFRQQLKLYMFFIRKLYTCIVKCFYSNKHKINHVTKFSYSYCIDYPYKIEELEPLKLQAILGIIGIYLWPHYQSKKEYFLKSDSYLKTRFYKTAAYLVLRNDLNEDEKLGILLQRKKKEPYALENNPDKSLRPNSIIVHNKGFSDNV